MINPFSLEGKTILVTGASSGIGRSIAIRCSQMGAKIIASGRSQERLEETVSALEGIEHRAIVADLVSINDVEKLVSSIDKLDGVVLSAGKGMMVPFLFADQEKFNDIFNINFFSPVQLLRRLVKNKKLNQQSSVVFIVSIGGTGRFTVANGVYGSSKAALNAMIHYCAQELASKRIRVNGICPGMVETPLIHSGRLTEEQHKADMEEYPLKRYGTPEDIANGAIYLLSGASSWVTGHSLVIDGGITTK